MYVVNTVLSNVHTDEAIALKIQELDKEDKVERVHIPFHDAGRRRLRLTTDAGTHVGVDLQTEALQDGDVLAGSEGTDRLILVEVAPSEAMALRMSEEVPPDQLFEFAIKLGHMLGNQHWPIAVENDVVLTPLSIDHKVMETVIRTHGFTGIEWEFVPIQPGDVAAAMPHIEHDHS